MRFLAVVLLALLIYGCKDDDLYGINSDTRTYLLANKKWQTASIFVKSPQGVIIRDQYILLPDYQKDNYILLRADSTFIYNDNAIPDPTATGPVLASGSWKLIMNEEYIRFTPHNSVFFTDSLKIVTISADQFSFERPVIDGTEVYSFRVIP